MNTSYYSNATLSILFCLQTELFLVLCFQKEVNLLDTSLNSRFAEIRKSLEMTQEKFGTELGLNKSSISNIEKNIRSVTDKHIKLLCSTFNVNEEWLRTGEGEMFTPHDIDEDLAYAFGQISAVKNEELKKALLLLTELTDEQIIYIANMVKALKDDNK